MCWTLDPKNQLFPKIKNTASVHLRISFFDGEKNHFHRICTVTKLRVLRLDFPFSHWNFFVFLNFDEKTKTMFFRFFVKIKKHYEISMCFEVWRKFDFFVFSSKFKNTMKFLSVFDFSSFSFFHQNSKTLWNFLVFLTFHRFRFFIKIQKHIEIS